MSGSLLPGTHRCDTQVRGGQTPPSGERAWRGLYSPRRRCKSVFLQRFTQQTVYSTRLDHCQDGGKNIGVPQEERVLIGDVERRLAKKYTALPHDHVAAVVQHAYAQFRSSRVRDFIPLLVERRADEELEELSVLRPDLAAVAFGDLVLAAPRPSG
jgi:hypothetical protein